MMKSRSKVVSIPTWTLGQLSEKYETGGRGPGTVSSGAGDPGGVSYGVYQMMSRDGGTVAVFVGQADFPWAKAFAGLAPGSPAFTARWREVAEREPEAFRAAQHAFVRRTHFEPLAARLRREPGLDVSARSPALQDVVWSTAVQHGPRTQVVQRALDRLKGPAGALDVAARDFDERLIRAIYAERGARNAAGQLKYFRRASKAVQAGVARRFAEEERDALASLAAAAA
jgi:hypothetical protein